MLALAAATTFLSFDDAASIHERLARAATRSLDAPVEYGRLLWPALYFPFLTGVAIILLDVARRYPGPVRNAMVGGLAALVAAVVLELSAFVLIEISGLTKTAWPLVCAIAIEEGAEVGGWILIAASLTAVLRTHAPEPSVAGRITEEHARGSRPAASGRVLGRLAQAGPDARHELRKGEGLRHVVVGAELEATCALLGASPCCEHDHWHGAARRSQPTENVEAVEIGEAQVEDDERDAAARDSAECLRRGPNLLGWKALRLQSLANERCDPSLILDHEDRHVGTVPRNGAPRPGVLRLPTKPRSSLHATVVISSTNR
jgi:hypothetical protein